jgi:arginine repressor
MTKSYRQGQILQLIQQRKIHTQEELAHELSQIGIAATQVTLSRDIRELGLAPNTPRSRTPRWTRAGSGSTARSPGPGSR